VRPLLDLMPSSSKALPLDDMAKRFSQGARLPEMERHLSWQQVFSAEMREGLMERERRGHADPLEAYRARYAETEDADRLARLQDLDLGIDLVDRQLVKTDRTSMATSLEARVPLLDPVVAELAFALPARHKVRWLSKKRLLRKAAEPLLPREVMEGRKQGFGIPAASWLRGDLEPFMREVLSQDNLRRQGYFRPDVVSRLIDDHVARRANYSRHLWTLMVFGLWAERVEAGPPGAVAAAGAG
jgi:asparagine synthase (glutamine-hydrolysing)